ncbi:MAG: pentapeptide repeat-containing protein [Leptospiraceae bacterium]|nr:pentapeptide repeat-containing protein [Leptospiraceae bacterium]
MEKESRFKRFKAWFTKENFKKLWVSIKKFYKRLIEKLPSLLDYPLLLILLIGLPLFLYNYELVSLKEFQEIEKKERYDLILKLIGGLGALYLLIQTVKKNLEVERNNNENLITDRFVKAVEQLGSEKAEVRLGGIYTLERIGLQSKKDRERIVNLLCAFVRERSKIDPEKKLKSPYEDKEEKEEIKPEIDIQAVIDILFSTQEFAEYEYDLSNSKIHKIKCKEGLRFNGEVNFYKSKFNGEVNFYKSKFNGNIDFYGSKFNGKAIFRGSKFIHSHFKKCEFNGITSFSECESNGFAFFEGSKFFKVSFRESKFNHLLSFNWNENLKSLSKGSLYKAKINIPKEIKEYLLEEKLEVFNKPDILLY